MHHSIHPRSLRPHPSSLVTARVPEQIAAQSAACSSRRVRRWALAVRARFSTARCGLDRGMTTAEYAIGTIAACAFAGVLFKVVTGQQVVGLLTSAVGRALATLGGA